MLILTCMGAISPTDGAVGAGMNPTVCPPHPNAQTNAQTVCVEVLRMFFQCLHWIPLGFPVSSQ